MLLQDPAAWRGRQTHPDKCKEFLCQASAAAIGCWLYGNSPFPFLAGCLCRPILLHVLVPGEAEACATRPVPVLC